MPTRACGLALLLALTQWAPAAAQATARADTTRTLLVGQVTGRLHEAVHRLPFAMVEALAGTSRRRVMTDAAGRYVVPDLPAGEVTVSVSHAGYEPLSLVVVVPTRGSVAVDLEMAAKPVRLQALDVSTAARTRLRPDGTIGADEGSLSELEMQVLEVGPGMAQAGIVDILGSLPGSEPGEATDVLFMRGSTADMKLVLLDGVPVYTPFHVAGLLRTFEPSVIDQAELHVGGAPARFDGGLSHILELTTRSARRDGIHFSGSMDLLAGTAALEVPLGSRAGVIASGRRLHDLAGAQLVGDRPYGYHDGLVSIDFDAAEGHSLRATGFWNTESVALDLGQTAPDDARWSNRAGSVSYRSDLGAAELEVTAGLSGYEATLPIQPGHVPGALVPPALLATARTDRARVVGEALWGTASAPIRAGLSFERIDAAFSARVLDGLGGADSRGGISAVGAFVDATRPIAPDLSVRAGLRVDHFADRATRLAPRASIRWAVAPEALLTVTAGRYHQPTRTPEIDIEQTLVEVAEGELPPSELLPVATADHVVMSLDQRLSGAVRLGLQGFWKSFDGLPGVDGTTIRSSGVDVRVLRGSERVAAWLGYGLSWYWSRSDLSGRPTDFAGRHLLSAGISGTISGPLRGEARVAFGSGLPYTSIPVAYADDAPASAQTVVSQTEVGGEESLNTFAAELDQSFLRLDAELFAVIEPSWGGRQWRLRPYLRLLNALDRRDSLFYAFERWRSDSVRPLAELPVLPLLGVAISF